MISLKVKRDAEEFVGLLSGLAPEEFLGLCKLLGIRTTEIKYKHCETGEYGSREVAMKDSNYKMELGMREVESLLDDLIEVFVDLKRIRRKEILFTMREAANKNDENSGGSNNGTTAEN